MTQADFSSIDATLPFGTIRRELKERVDSLRSLESGATEPGSTVAGQFVLDTANGLIAQRDTTNSNWAALWFANQGPMAPLSLPATTPTTTVKDRLDAFEALGGLTNLTEEGADVWIEWVSGVNSIAYPDVTVDTGWVGRNALVTTNNVLNWPDDQVLTVYGAGVHSGTPLVEFTQPNEFWFGRAISTGWVTMATNVSATVTETSTRTLTTTDWYKRTFLCDATSGAFTLSLPNLVTSSQFFRGPIHFKKIDSTANAVTIDTDGSELIDGAASQSLASQWDSISILPHDGAFYII